MGSPHENDLDPNYIYVYRDGMLVATVPINKDGSLPVPFRAEAGDVAFLPVVVGETMTVDKMPRIPVDGPYPKDPPAIEGTEVTRQS
jgi:hypothetical protein